MDENAQQEIDRLFSSQHGLITWDQALAAGLTPRNIDDRFARGAWLRAHRAVYRHAAAPVTRSQRLMAATLALPPGSAVSHRAAAGMWGSRRHGASAVEVSHPTTAWLRLAGVVVHTRPFMHDDHVTRIDGTPVTTPARTLVDLGAVERPVVVRWCLEDWLADRIVTLDQIHAALVEHSRRGRRGVGVLRAIVEERELGEGVADSGWEARLARVLATHGLPPPAHHHLVTDEFGRVIAELDYAYPEERIAIELDGYAAHLRSRETFERDRERQNELELRGWRVLRFTATMLRREPARVAQRVRAMLDKF